MWSKWQQNVASWFQNNYIYPFFNFRDHIVLYFFHLFACKLAFLIVSNTPSSYHHHTHKRHRVHHTQPWPTWSRHQNITVLYNQLKSIHHGSQEIYSRIRHSFLGGRWISTNADTRCCGGSEPRCMFVCLLSKISIDHGCASASVRWFLGSIMSKKQILTRNPIVVYLHTLSVYFVISEFRSSISVDLRTAT